jgi:hypothetical protein
VPRTDEVGAFFEREIAERDDLKRGACGFQEDKSRPLHRRFTSGPIRA